MGVQATNNLVHRIDAVTFQYIWKIWFQICMGTVILVIAWGAPGNATGACGNHSCCT